MGNKITIGLRCADTVSKIVASWGFIITYTGAMILWIVLHLTGVLDIDSADFVKYNLILSWFAGTQASIVMMSQNRQSERDRKTLEKGVALDKNILKRDIVQEKRVKELIRKVTQLEEIISLLADDEDID